MYLGSIIGKFKAEDDATLVVPRSQSRALSQEVQAGAAMPEPVIIERIVEKPVIVERVVEVEKIVEVPVAVKSESESNFFEDTIPAEWSEDASLKVS